VKRRPHPIVRRRREVVRHKAQLEYVGGGAQIAGVVTERPQAQLHVERDRWLGQRRVAPQAEAVLRELPPRKEPARVFLATRRDVAVSEVIRNRNAMAGGDVAQQRQQRCHLRLGKRLAAVVVDLDAERRGVQVGVGAPARLASVPGTGAFVHELIDQAVAPHQVVRADLAGRIGQRAQRPFGTVAAGVVQDHVLRLALAQVRRGPPDRRHAGALRQRRTGGQHRAQHHQHGPPTATAGGRRLAHRAQTTMGVDTPSIVRIAPDT